MALSSAAIARSAEPKCERRGAPWIRLEYVGTGWKGRLSDSVSRQFRAGLVGEGFSVCQSKAGRADPEGSNPPIATIVLASDDARSVQVDIEVRDGVTQKRVARELDLAKLPPDGRALGIAVAADELLRASWAELALQTRRAAEEPPPEVVESAVKRSLTPGYSSGDVELEGRFAYEVFDGPSRSLGADAAVRHWLARPVGWELWLGMRSLPSARAPHGAIAGNAVGGGASALVELASTSALGLELESGLWAMHLGLRASAEPGATGRDGSELALYARGNVAVVLRATSSLAIRLRAGAGVPLRSVSALDGDDVAAGARGLTAFSTLGMAVEL